MEAFEKSIKKGFLFLSACGTACGTLSVPFLKASGVTERSVRMGSLWWTVSAMNKSVSTENKISVVTFWFCQYKAQTCSSCMPTQASQDRGPDEARLFSLSDQHVVLSDKELRTVQGMDTTGIQGQLTELKDPRTRRTKKNPNLLGSLG